MSAEKLTRRRSRAEWIKLLEEYERRNCSVQEFAQRHGVSESALSYQRSKLRKETAFVPAIEAAPQADSEVILELPSGARLTIRTGQ